MDVEALRLHQATELIARLEREDQIFFANTRASAQLAAALAVRWDQLSGEVLASYLMEVDEVIDLVASDEELSELLDWASHLMPPPGEVTPGGDDGEAPGSARIEQILQQYLRPYWIPVVEPEPASSAAPRPEEARRSRYGGRPWLGAGERWPLCGHCQRPLRFFLQLDLASLPAELAWPHRDGLVQLFYCIRSEPVCEVEAEAWNPFAPSVLARWIAPGELLSGGTGAGEAVMGVRDPRWQPRRIRSWQRAGDEFPAYTEGDCDPVIAELHRDPDLSSVVEARDHEAHTGDKLGGWPAWVQSAEYPACPRCQQRMAVLLQVESNGYTGHQFGDLGAGHLSQCPEHPESVAFAWACH